MDIRRITFEAPFAEPHLSIDCWPPFVDVNQIFRAAFHSFVQPHQLAIDAGRVDERTATKLLAQAYAEGVVARSPTPAYEAWIGSDWLKFFLRYPDHFDELRRVCEVRRNWDEPGEGTDGDRPDEHT
jgi:hypothetical protein